MFGFEINAHCANTSARCGTFETPHGPVHTPRFMPVGTLATVKGISTNQLRRTGAQMVLSNTYHLHLQPGEEIVAAAVACTGLWAGTARCSPTPEAFRCSAWET